MTHNTLSVTGTLVDLPYDDLDTDQIIPAHFVTNFRQGGFSNALFANRRLDENFPLNFPESQGARILLAGDNFGCGSSRESAVWAIQQAGFSAVMATSFGDIFADNAARCGLIAAKISPESANMIRSFLKKDPRHSFTVDATSRSLRMAEGLNINFSLSQQHYISLKESDSLIEKSIERRSMILSWLRNVE